MELPRYAKHVTGAVVLVLLILLGLFGFLFAYFYFGDDLVLELQANQTSFRTTNTAPVAVDVTMQTSGQLFCVTTCRLALIDANSRSISVEELNVTRGQQVNRTFTLAPGAAGTGQSLYSVIATCQNIESTLCPTYAPERRRTVLLTVNYGLDVEEERLKPTLERSITGMLEQLRSIDLALQEISLMMTETQRLRAGFLAGALAAAQEEFAEHNLLLENAKVLWAEQAYIPLAEMLEGADTTNATMTALHSDVLGIRSDLLALPQTHNGLMQRIIIARERMVALAAQYAPLNDDAVAGPALNRSAATMNAIVESYAADQFINYTDLDEDIANVERNIAALNSTLQQRYAYVVGLGNNITLQEQQILCNCTNITVNLATLPDVCVNITNASYRSMYCVERNATPVNMTQLAAVVLQVPQVNSSINTTLPEHVPLCCVFGECKACCNACADEAYPVIFVHGHAFNSFNSPEYSLGGYFTKIQQRLQEEGYVDAGILTPSSTMGEVTAGEWGLSGRPVTVRVTYYYNFYKLGDEYVIITQKSENIETYAIRLNELVKTVQHHTGKDKVQIVTHSMGGLVVRRYMQLFGEESVDKVIMIGTPNNGISDRTRTLCPVFGESKECEDMSAESVFMRKLNDPENRPSVPVVTITGHGCPVNGRDGDGVVETASVRLEYAKNYDINGTCTDFFQTDLHTELLNVDKYPQVYEIIRDELK